MAAHLHRYGSELSLTSDIVQDLKKYNTDYHQTFVDNGLRPHHPTEGLEAIIRGIDQISSQLSAIRAFRDELQLKTTNVLALVRLLFHIVCCTRANTFSSQLVDNTQAMNDLLLIKNSKSMEAILHASQVEAQQSGKIAAQSQKVAEQMHKILQATQEETKMSRRVALQSQRLSEEMKKDSVAMKTVRY
jgi:hypothetical protein